MKPAIAAIVLNLDLEGWSGLPLEELLTEKEKNSVKVGEIKRGSLSLPDVNLPLSNQEEYVILEVNKENENETDSSNTNNEEEAQSSSMLKKRSLEMEDEQDEPPAKKAVSQ
ncbi:unnamed protein product [Cylicostephanus goldi]|uniref:Uncharacterized protein n=1 Tax=Cylicostephanus goldi TaxID=71465 RepID=A0A3P6UUB6_CYLGO|nr:unnamed protein product [Cylicostephanus goldi]